MKRHIPGLGQAGQNEENLPNGEYLVEVTRMKYRWHPHKPYYSVQFQVLAPDVYRSHIVTGRLYCSVSALWKLSWFLTDFGHDPDLLNRDDIDEKAVVGLKGMLRLCHHSVNGRSFPALEGFAPADRWNTSFDQNGRSSKEDTGLRDDREVA